MNGDQTVRASDPFFSVLDLFFTPISTKKKKSYGIFTKVGRRVNERGFRFGAKDRQSLSSSVECAAEAHGQ
ncbi:hypothetical protein V6Z11_A09G202300 [Gossypium hirsutum]